MSLKFGTNIGTSSLSKNLDVLKKTTKKTKNKQKNLYLIFLQNLQGVGLKIYQVQPKTPAHLSIFQDFLEQFFWMTIMSTLNGYFQNDCEWMFLIYYAQFQKHVRAGLLLPF